MDKLLRSKVIVFVSVIAASASILTFTYLSSSEIQETGSFILSFSSLAASFSIGLLGIPIAHYVWNRKSHNDELNYQRKPSGPLVTLDSNILVHSFLYDHFEDVNKMRRFNPAEAKKDSYVVRLVRYGYARGFVSERMLKEAEKILREKYNFTDEQLNKFVEDVTSFAYVNRPKNISNMPHELIDNISKYFVHRKDEEFVRESLQINADAIVTDDRRIVKNPSVIHYVPILYTEDFIRTMRGSKKKITRTELEKEAYKNVARVMGV